MAADAKNQFEITEQGNGLSDEEIFAKRLGPYWDSTLFRPLIIFEAAAFRLFRRAVDESMFSKDELPETIDRLRNYFSNGENAVIGDAFLALGFLAATGVRVVFEVVKKMDFSFRPQYQYRDTMRIFLTHADDVLASVKRRARAGRHLWRDEFYWPVQNENAKGKK